jgi:ketosteroid isomerase-like protein
LLIITVVPFALGQSAHTALAANSNVEQEVRQVDDELRKALVRSDTATLDRILADDWTVTHTNGKEQSKAQFLDAVKSGRVKFQSMELDDVRVRVYRYLAVLTARSTNKIIFKGQESTGQVRIISVYVKRQGHWQNVTEQATSIAQ